MKYIILLVLLASWLMPDSLVYGQDALCPSNGFSTNPDSPKLPSVKPKPFDWRVERFQFNYKNRQVDEILSPFYDPQPFTNALFESKDMRHEDGWELIFREFGFENDEVTKKREPQAYPILVLYNKYTGLLRVFYAIKGEDRQGNFTSAAIQLFLQGFQFSTVQPLTSPVAVWERQRFTVPTDFRNNFYYEWFYADFPLNYDPCTCQRESTLQILSQLIIESNVTLEGNLAGTIKPADIQGSNSPKTVLDLAKLESGFDKAQQTFKSIEQFTSNEQKKADEARNFAIELYNTIFASPSNPLFQAIETETENKLQSFSDFSVALASSKFLQAGLKAAPYIAAGVSFLQAFVGGGKSGPDGIKLMPHVINASLSFKGNITTNFPFPGTSIALPGSLNAISRPGLASPYYNEVMGVFNILETPIIKTNNICEGSNCSRGAGAPGTVNSQLLKLGDKPLQYVLNPAAGFYPSPEVLVAYVLEFEPNLVENGLLYNQLPAGFIIETDKSLRTNYFNHSLLNQVTVKNTFYLAQEKYDVAGRYLGKAYTSIQPSRIYLKFLVNLKRRDGTGQNVLYVFQVPVNTERDPSLTQQVFVEDKVFENIFERGSNKQFNANSSITIRNATLKPDLYIPPGGGSGSVGVIGNRYQIYNAPEIIIEEETVLDHYGSDSRVVLEATPGTLINLANRQTITEFCNSSTYNPSNIRAFRGLPEENQEAQAGVEEEIEEGFLSAYPNPTSGFTTITYRLLEGTDVKVSITNLVGEEVKVLVNTTQQAGVYEIDLPTSDLPAGMYIYSLQTSTYKESKRLVIQK